MPIAAALSAECVAILIGERPGLSAPDSMGAYLTWQPSPQTTDADRNCISNIRPDGIGYADAAFKIAHLLRAMRARRLSGVRLKDDSDRLLVGRCRRAYRERSARRSDTDRIRAAWSSRYRMQCAWWASAP